MVRIQVTVLLTRVVATVIVVMRAHLALGLVLIGHLPAQQLASELSGANLLDRYCGDCHTGEDAEREFDVPALFSKDAQAQPGYLDRLELTVQRLRARTMPPPDEAQPTAEERRSMVAALAARAPSDAGQRVATVRRLTRVQYEHTVRDLFGIEWQVAELLPDEPAAHGFDGQGDVQNVSPLMFEKYLDAAASVASAVLADDEARARWFAADTGTALAKILPLRLARAFRRPVAEIQEQIAHRLTEFERMANDAGGGEAKAQHALLRGMLASPQFLFRTEFGQPQDSTRLSAYELAVRLSYMLVSTTPDDQLLRLAGTGELLDAKVLAAQAGRLARTHEGRRLAEDFATQWLSLRDVLTATADFRRYPQIWNRKLRPAFLEEALRCFAFVVAKDRSVLELLDADYTFVNKVLAKHYGLPKVGRGFHRVRWHDARRGGLLGMGAMLMTSSFPLRTSPVKRGKWILDKLLDSPPPPPPPDAGTLPKDDKPKGKLTLRQRLEQHRSRRRCAGCHAQMDALGFALENFDVVGLWRDELHGTAVDAKATLPDGTRIAGPVGLKKALLGRAEDFVRAMAKNLLVHGVGRNMTLADEPELARIVAKTRAGGDRFSALLEAIVTSPLFVMRDPGAAPEGGRR